MGNSEKLQTSRVPNLAGSAFNSVNNKKKKMGMGEEKKEIPAKPTLPMQSVTNFQLWGKACAELSLGYSPPLYRTNRAKQFLGLKSRLPLAFSSSSFPP